MPIMILIDDDRATISAIDFVDSAKSSDIRDAIEQSTRHGFIWGRNEHLSCPRGLKVFGEFTLNDLISKFDAEPHGLDTIETGDGE
jgi:hypothetical protein